MNYRISVQCHLHVSECPGTHEIEYRMAVVTQPLWGSAPTAPAWCSALRFLLHGAAHSALRFSRSAGALGASLLATLRSVVDGVVLVFAPPKRPTFRASMARTGRSGPWSGGTTGSRGTIRTNAGSRFDCPTPRAVNSMASTRVSMTSIGLLSVPITRQLSMGRGSLRSSASSAYCVAAFAAVPY